MGLIEWFASLTERLGRDGHTRPLTIGEDASTSSSKANWSPPGSPSSTSARGWGGVASPSLSFPSLFARTEYMNFASKANLDMEKLARNHNMHLALVVLQEQHIEELKALLKGSRFEIMVDQAAFNMERRRNAGTQ